MTSGGSKPGPSQGRSARRPARAYQGMVRGLSIAFLVLGAVILLRTLVAGGGPLSIGVLLGIVFLAVGAGRLWIASRTSH